MFNLEKSIAAWRKQMLAAGIKTPVPLDELENHLREDIQQHLKSGLDEQEAFNSAVQKIGKAQAVQTEFEKVEETKDARKWKMKEILFVALSILLPLVMGSLLLNERRVMTSAEQMSSLAAIAAFSLLIWVGRLGYGMFPVIRAKRIREAIAVSGSVSLALWWIIFLRSIAPGRDFTVGQFVVAFLWAFVAPGAAFIGLVFGIETAARKKAAMAGS